LRAAGDAPPADALAAAADAAWRGVRETASQAARMGRASYLGERATGVPDPGAVGMALFFASAGGTVRTLAPHLSGD
ncbi:DAK2 domain-containing protein, partial [Streptomyces sp. NPDC057521]